MLTLLVPILISFLLEGNQFRSATKFTLQLHEQSLQWLMKIGPKYPQVSMLIEFFVISCYDNTMGSLLKLNDINGSLRVLGYLEHD